MERSLEIKTKLRFKDTLKYQAYIAFKSIGNIIFLNLSLISLGMFIYKMINGQDTLDVRFTQAFILLIPPFLFAINVPLRVWKETKSLLEKSVLKDEVIYIFSQDKITLKTTEAEADVKWDNYIRIVETSYDFRLFIDKVQAQIVPKYSLSTEEIKELRSIIKSATSSQTLKLKES